jgi:hypothetical protein
VRVAPLLAIVAAPVLACPPGADDGLLVGRDGLQAAWKLADAPAIEVSRHFSLSILVCPADAELRVVDATMPAHRHGMNYRPSLKPLGGGRWRADGLLFHMAGAWELRIELRHSGRSVELRQAIELP